ncbi:ATP-grasp domain-containing protein [Apilactobacillus xinyiensis]|uniref:ATP-grasp domain-containing protein n=1 Tax=Apilactobacillus xinyiensis TaxID=2841032 RepID=UPI00200DAAF7|nr:ATP-grasp domain-containing protein [Apilactobacillus xinyiensis]MCL0329691.1 ATP-grasp domain-containing protein [Apilactobacillus xinyiensis]
MNNINLGDSIGIIGSSIINLDLIAFLHNHGFKVGLYEDTKSTEMNKYVDYYNVSSLNDLDELKRFVHKSDFVIYNSENLDSDFIKQNDKFIQGNNVLDFIQDRIVSKTFFEQLNINTAPYVTVLNIEDLENGIKQIGFPAILKPIQKSTVNGDELILRSPNDLVYAEGILKSGTFILEAYLDDKKDYSIIVSKGLNGFQISPVINNYYDNPNEISATLSVNESIETIEELQDIARKLATNVDYLGPFMISMYIGSNKVIYLDQISILLNSSIHLFKDIVFENYLRGILGNKLIPYQINNDKKTLYNFSLDNCENAFKIVMQDTDSRVKFYQDKRFNIGGYVIKTN